MSLRDRLKFTGPRRASAPTTAGQATAVTQVTAPNGAGAPVPVSQPAAPNGAAPAQTLSAAYGEEFLVDLKRRRDQLVARVAELQWDLGGLVYEMAVRDRMQMELLVKRAVVLQDADAELGEVERILRMEETGTAGSCGNCGAPHSSGATFCWQCGQPLLKQVSGESILRG